MISTAPADSSPAPELVLVVDDILDNRTVAGRYLRGAGYRVRLAESGDQALRGFAEEPPDLVLLDVLMPEMDGFETCRRIRELPGGEATPIVFLTALGEDQSYAQAMDSGADDFLTKPISRTELIIRVRSLLRIRRLNRELVESYALVRSQRDALASLQRQKEDLTALLVHDLKNPLFAILMDAQFALGRITTDAEAEEAIGSVLTSTESLHRMVMNLLDIGRSEEGALVPRYADAGVEALLRGACALMRRRTEEKQQTLTLTMSPLEPVRADPDLLRRVIENLLDNGIRHAPIGSTVQVQAWAAEDGSFELAVKDNGSGVAPADRTRIFEKWPVSESWWRTITRRPWPETCRGGGHVDHEDAMVTGSP